MSTVVTEKAQAGRRGVPRVWWIVGAAFVTIVLGYVIRNSFSVFYPAIVEDFGWERGGTALMFSLAVIVYGAVAPVAGALIDRYETRVVFPVGALIAGVAFALCGLASTQWQFYVLYGVVTAFGLSIVGWTPICAVVARWFTHGRGTVFGILGAGFGTSLVSASVAQSLIDWVGWQRAYAVIGVAAMIVLVPLWGLLLRRSRPREALGQAAPSQAKRSADAGAPRDSGWTLSRALRSPRFWYLFAAVFCLLGVAEQILIVHQVYYFRDLGYSPIRAATIYTVFGVLFVIGNLATSFSDRLGRETMLVPACLVSAAAGALLLLAGGPSWLAWVSAAGTGLGVGMAGTVYYASVADIFQGRHYGAIQGATTVGFALGGAVSPWAAGYIHDKTDSYLISWVAVCVALVASAALVWLAAPRREARAR